MQQRDCRAHEHAMSSNPTRYENADGISDLSIAIDEIYFLRAVIADEADILSAHLDLKSFPKSRRAVAAASVERMRRIANGEMFAATRDKFDQQMALRRVGASPTLSNSQWAEQRGLKRVDHKEKTDG